MLLFANTSGVLFYEFFSISMPLFSRMFDVYVAETNVGVKAESQTVFW